MRLKWGVALVVLVLSIIWAESRFAASHASDDVKLKEGIEQTKQGEKTLRIVDTVYKLDTIRLTRAVTKYRQFRDTLKLTDTVQVILALNQADSAIKACTETVLTCNQKDSAHKVIEDGLRKQNEALKREIPGKTEKTITAVKWLITGIVIGRAASK